MKSTVTLCAALFLAGAFLQLFIVYSLGYFSLSPQLETLPPSDPPNSRIGSIGSVDSIDRPKDNIYDIYNETLGFQEVFAISLAERTDKQDAISVQARLTNISVTLVDGVVGKDVSEKAKPYGMHRSAPEVGCWRSHLNVMQHMVRHRISTGLIFEDDADWDVSIKAQMLELARGARWLLNTGDASPDSPYGDGWDVLWIGHCSIKVDPADNRRWVIPKDPTVVPPGQRTIGFGPDMTPWESGPERDTQTRIVFNAGFGWCSAAWAVSLAGAEKIIYRQSMSPFEIPVDDGVGKMCEQKTMNMSCIAPFPAIVGASRSAGSMSRDSDIRATVGVTEGDIRRGASSERVMFSTRMNVERLIAHESAFKSEFPNVTGRFMDFEKIGSATGHPMLLPQPGDAAT